MKPEGNQLGENKQEDKNATSSIATKNIPASILNTAAVTEPNTDTPAAKKVTPFKMFGLEPLSQSLKEQVKKEPTVNKIDLKTEEGREAAQNLLQELRNAIDGLSNNSDINGDTISNIIDSNRTSTIDLTQDSDRLNKNTINAEPSISGGEAVTSEIHENPLQSLEDQQSTESHTDTLGAINPVMAPSEEASQQEPALPEATTGTLSPMGGSANTEQSPAIGEVNTLESQATPKQPNPGETPPAS